MLLHGNHSFIDGRDHRRLRREVRRDDSRRGVEEPQDRRRRRRLHRARPELTRRAATQAVAAHPIPQLPVA